MQLCNDGSVNDVTKISISMLFRIVYYLMNIKVVPRTLYLSRHGQSHYNSLKKLGGDSDLTDCGAEYSR